MPGGLNDIQVRDEQVSGPGAQVQHQKRLHSLLVLPQSRSSSAHRLGDPKQPVLCSHSRRPVPPQTSFRYKCVLFVCAGADAAGAFTLTSWQPHAEIADVMVRTDKATALLRCASTAVATCHRPLGACLLSPTFESMLAFTDLWEHACCARDHEQAHLV